MMYAEEQSISISSTRVIFATLLVAIVLAAMLASSKYAIVYYIVPLCFVITFILTGTAMHLFNKREPCIAYAVGLEKVVHDLLGGLTMDMDPKTKEYILRHVISMMREEPKRYLEIIARVDNKVSGALVDLAQQIEIEERASTNISSIHPEELKGRADRFRELIQLRNLITSRASQMETPVEKSPGFNPSYN